MSKLFLIHGEDQLNSRNYLNALIKELNPNNSKSVFQTSGKNLTPEVLLQNIQSNSFFGDERIFVIENLNTGNRSKYKTEILSQLSDQDNISEEIIVIIWESLTLTATQVKHLKNFINKEFKLPSVIFSFLDNLKPNNPKQNHDYFYKVIKNQPVELIFFMLSKRVRQLFEVRIGNQIKAAPWQLGKLKAQSNYFSENQLKKLYMDLILLDYNNKTGNLNTTITNELDMLLIRL